MRAVEGALTSTRTPPRLNRAPPTNPASVSPHPTAPTRTVPHPTTRPASVVRSDVLQVQACVVRNLSTPVTLHHRVLKQVAAQQTMKHANADRKDALAQQVSFAPPPLAHALKATLVPMLVDLYLTLLTVHAGPQQVTRPMADTATLMEVNALPIPLLSVLTQTVHP